MNAWIRTVLRAAFDLGIALAVAAAALAIVIPVLVRQALLRPGDAAGTVLIFLVTAGCVAMALFRPNGPLRRR
jgi:hypothetical protein